MGRSYTFEAIKNTGIVAIIRGSEELPLEDVTYSLYAGGIRAIEVSLTTPNGLALIEQLKKMELDDLHVGAGTVLDPETAIMAIQAGATFVLSPTLSEQVVKVCNRNNVLAIPGVLSPTEILRAWELGISAVKVFPVSSLGPEYIKDLKGPLPQIDMMPVGGVNLNNVANFIEAGAFSVGVGGQLVSSKLISSGNYDELTKLASRFLAKIKMARSKAMYN